MPTTGSEGKAAFSYFPVDKEATTDDCMGWALTGSRMGGANPQNQKGGAALQSLGVKLPQWA